MSSFKPKRGSSFFLKSSPRSQYAFGICLSSRSDEDDEYKIIRTDFADTPAAALKLALVHTDMFDFEDTELYSVVEWDKDIVKSLSRKQLFGREIEVRLLTVNTSEESSFVEQTTSELDEIFVES